ncbi:hypothetical protein BGX30_014093 [Mortierella sp. GBA39]|nr:hypothetical protein BGX30_014093 [Mortierella sp. GBA39]
MLPFRIMGALPAQQVVSVELRAGRSGIDRDMMNLAIQRHSTSLRELRFQKDNYMFDISVSTILKECYNLEVLHILCTRAGGFYVTLDDALERPWFCAKLTRLALGISGCEDLYRRIGALTALKELNLKMIPLLYESGEVDVERMQDDRMSFPAMLSLPDPQTGMPGYLEVLQGLAHGRFGRD